METLVRISDVAYGNIFRLPFSDRLYVMDGYSFKKHKCFAYKLRKNTFSHKPVYFKASTMVYLFDSIEIVRAYKNIILLVERGEQQFSKQ